MCSHSCVFLHLPDTAVSIAVVDSFSFFKISVEASDIRCVLKFERPYLVV